MSFDPDTFMSQTVDQPLATEFTLVPVNEYMAAVDDFDRDAFETVEFEYKKGKLAGTPGKMFKFNCPIVINDDKVRQELGRDKVIITKQFILDLDEDGKLAFGTNRNVELGRLRDAVNQNGPGPWSPAQLRGAGPFMVKVTHVEFERKDGSKGKRAEIDRIVRVV